jgi:DNA-directed RNA polymerase II subunit RPB2
VPESQHLPGQELLEKKKYKVSFGQIYLSKPMMTESDGETTTLFPHEARLRNLTCVPRRARPARARTQTQP